MSTMENYKGYKLWYYPKCNAYPNHDNRYQVCKSGSYDDAEYYWAYSYNKKNWTVIYKGRRVEQFTGTFEQVVDLLEKQNRTIKSILVYN